MRFTLLFSVLSAFAALVQARPVPRQSSSSLWGITYNAKNPDGSCHTADEVTQFIRRFQENGIKNIRTYSQECNQLVNIANAIDSVGGDMTVLAAVWIQGTAQDAQEIATLEWALNQISNKNIIYGIAVGNELVQSGLMNSGQVVKKINEVKAVFPDYKVGTVDTPTAYSSDMIDASDIVLLNIHPFFAGVPADQAAQNLQQQFNNFKQKAGNKQVLVGEVGWPSAGEADGQAQPSVANLATVVKSLEGIDLQYYFFEAQDSDWKSPGAFDVEQHWGLLYSNGKSKIKGFH